MAEATRKPKSAGVSEFIRPTGHPSFFGTLAPADAR
jgi:hypothetical protein